MGDDANETAAGGAPSKERLLLCDCGASMSLDAAALGAEGAVSTSLCRREIGVALTALAEDARAGRRTIIACAQETATFEEAAEEVAEALAAEAQPGEVAAPALSCVDIRDRAGWSDDGGAAAAKMAALLADAALTRPATPSLPIVSEGRILVYGDGETAMAAATRLAAALSVTCLLRDPGDAAAPRNDEIAVATGRLVHVAGGLGAFAIRVDGFAEAEPSGRGGLRFGAARNGARSNCDLIVDLSGDAPLVPAPQKRDGYLRADPRDALAVERALFDAAQLVGEFDKPLYIRFEESLCAHSRARQAGCDRCLSVCPTGAITAPEKSDHVAIDPLICAGCGACAAVCPSGAARYDDPAAAFLATRLRTLADAYRRAGGAAPRLLVHDAEHGAEMIALAARHGRGLPSDVIPMELAEMGGFAHPLLLAALANGFSQAIVLLSPTSERAPMVGQIALARSLAAGVGVDAAETRLQAIAPGDPDALSDLLYEARPTPLAAAPVLAMGEGRELTRIALTGLAGGAAPEAPIALDALNLDDPVLGEGLLPGGAPYGAVLVDSESCTLCLACVSLCPSGALGDNPDKPELRFQEDACLQCGICARACPEDAITLAPRYDLSPEARAHVTLHGEEPAACIECGALFGVKSTIDRIVEKLAEKHWMFTNSDNARLIQMCDDCRVRAQYHGAGSPFQMGTPRVTRTTEDYLKEREEGDA